MTRSNYVRIYRDDRRSERDARKVNGMLTRLEDEGMEIATELNPTVLRVTVGAGQFEHLVMNLVLNVRDAILRGRRTTLSARPAEMKDAPEANAPRASYA
jgi:hypothetical protein